MSHFYADRDDEPAFDARGRRGDAHSLCIRHLGPPRCAGGIVIMTVETAPTILFLTSSVDHHPVLRWAAETGFRAVLASPTECRPQGRGVLMLEGWEVDADGSGRALLGPTAFSPLTVALLERSASAVQAAQALVLGSSAWWPHHQLDADSSSPAGPPVMMQGTDAEDRDGREMASIIHGVLRFTPGEVPLRLLDAHLPATRGPAGRLEHARELAESALEARVQDWTYTMRPLLHRTLAPCIVMADAHGNYSFTDPLHVTCTSVEESEAVLRQWLTHLFAGTRGPAPVMIPVTVGSLRQRPATPEAGDLPEASACTVDPTIFPRLFGTPLHIDTAYVPAASFTYLDERLEAGTVEGSRPAEALHRRICRRRDRGDTSGPLERRFVEPGVGRACLVTDIHVPTTPAFHDYTVLGVGLTPYSEGGYVEIGRKIDGKASLVRADHRRLCSERLEAAGCRAGRVLAIAALPADDIEMPDGTTSPSALVARGFRCAYRVKQLDPLICCLHSIQHTPLVGAYLMEQAVRLRGRGNALAGSVHDDDLLARSIDAQAPSQEALRALVERSTGDAWGSWPSLVDVVRLAAIDTWAPYLLRAVRARLAIELAHDVTTRQYVRWFAGCLGRQLAAWRSLRFLHDYHQPGTSRWRPDHLYTLGENNVTLLAEFPDLDTGVFVDDDENYLGGAIQLTPGDVALLRTAFGHFHARDVAAAETVVRTLALIACRHDRDLAVTAVQDYRNAYTVGEAAL